MAGHFLSSIALLIFLAGGCGQKAAEFTSKSDTGNPVTTVTTKTSQTLRSFATGFEDAADFDGFYITPVPHMDTTYQAKSTEQVRTGSFAHKAWITGANPSSAITNNNHRGYPTVQLHKLEGGGFACPCRIVLYVWLDMALAPGEWFSIATLSADASDNWSRVVLVNISDEHIVHLMHVPNQGEGKRLFQTTSLTFPQRQWVKIETYIDFSAEGGVARVWQDGVLVSEASVAGGHGKLEQAHFGMYAAPSIADGVVFNDDLLITEVRE